MTQCKVIILRTVIQLRLLNMENISTTVTKYLTVSYNAQSIWSCELMNVWMFILFTWLVAWNTWNTQSPSFSSSFTREVWLAAITVYYISFFLTFWFPAVRVWRGRQCVRIFRLFVYALQVIVSINVGHWPFSINCGVQTYCPNTLDLIRKVRGWSSCSTNYLQAALS